MAGVGTAPLRAFLLPDNHMAAASNPARHECVLTIYTVIRSSRAVSINCAGANAIASAATSGGAAWSAARRGISDAVVAAVVGSFAYNATIGAAALVRPLRVTDAGPVRWPAVAMSAHSPCPASSRVMRGGHRAHGLPGGGDPGK